LSGRGESSVEIAIELIHLPDKPAGVWDTESYWLAYELIHLPDKPAGVLTGILKLGKPGESDNFRHFKL